MWKPSAFCKPALFALAVILFAVQTSEAQIGAFVGGGGGNRGGGGTRWGVSIGTPFNGGYGYGSPYGGFGSPYYGGGYYGAGYGYASPYYGGSYYSSPYIYSSGYASPYYGGSYYSSPYTYSSGYNYLPSYTYGYTPSYSGVASYDYNNAYMMPSTSYQSGYYSPDSSGANNQQMANAASIEVMVPANASLWFDGNATKQTGPDRLFTTPALPEGKASSYELKASWKDANGNDVTRTRTIHVAPNQHTFVNFMDGAGSTSSSGFTTPPAPNPNPGTGGTGTSGKTGGDGK